MPDRSHDGRLLFRILGVAGFGAAAVAALLDSTMPTGRGWYAVLVAACVGAGTILTAVLFLGPQVRTTLANLDVFVPIGVLLLAELLIAWAAAIVPLSSGSPTTIDFSGLAVPLSFAVIAAALLTAIQIMWTTFTLFDVAANRRIDLMACLAQVRPSFWRGATGLLIGTAGLLAILAGMLSMLKSGAFATVVIGAAVSAVTWNAATIALTPVLLEGRGSLGAAIARGFRTSLDVSLRISGALVSMLLLLGVVSYAYGTTSSPGNFSTNSKWNAALTWLPAFPDESGWYAVWCEVWSVPENPFVEFLLSLPLLLLGLTLMLRVVEHVRETSRVA